MANSVMTTFFLVVESEIEPKMFSIEPKHRRRMETEAKAKVVASIWETEFIQYLIN